MKSDLLQKPFFGVGDFHPIENLSQFHPIPKSSFLELEHE